jgi:hypothetical protein
MRQRPDENPNDWDDEGNPQDQQAVDFEESNHKLTKQRPNNKEKL